MRTQVTGIYILQYFPTRFPQDPSGFLVGGPQSMPFEACVLGRGRVPKGAEVHGSAGYRGAVSAYVLPWQPGHRRDGGEGLKQVSKGPCFAGGL